MTDNRGSDAKKAYGRWAEDIGSKILYTPPGRYSHKPVGGITYGRIVQDGLTGVELVGFLWFSDAEQAAGYVGADSNIPTSGNAGVVWYAELDSHCVQGDAPSDTFAALTKLDLGHRIGRINTDSVRNLAGIEDLRAIAKSAAINEIE